MLLDYGRNLEDVPLVLQYNKRDLSDPYALEELYRKLEVNGAAVFEAVATEDSGVLQTLSTISKHVIRSLRGQQFSAEAEVKSEPGDSLSGLQAPVKPVQTAEIDPVAEPTPAAETTEIDAVAELTPAAETTEIDAVAELTPAARMEDAILSEEDHPEANVIDDLAASAQTALDMSLDELRVEGEPLAAAQLDSEFSIASVGEAARSGERGVRIPLVISDKGGRTSNLVLTIRLDPLIDGESD